MGVFATRSPFRPNAIGLSSVKLEGIEKHPQYGMVLRVSGADLMDGTPILDIKPYLPFTDSHPQATGGFTDGLHLQPLKVVIPEDLKQTIPADQLDALTGVLEQDPRPSYQDDPQRVYGFFFWQSGNQFHRQRRHPHRLQGGGQTVNPNSKKGTHRGAFLFLYSERNRSTLAMDLSVKRMIA